MVSKIVGTFLKQNTRTKWLKLSVALILSNLFFFLLFSNSSDEQNSQPSHAGSVQILLRAELQTPFQKGKKVSIINREKRLLMEGVLEEMMNEDGKLAIWVKEERASLLFQYTGWEIIPYLKYFQMPTLSKGETHEIRY